jgi:hypothetical protein
MIRPDKNPDKKAVPGPGSQEDNGNPPVSREFAPLPLPTQSGYRPIQADKSDCQEPGAALRSAPISGKILTSISDTLRMSRNSMSRNSTARYGGWSLLRRCLRCQSASSSCPRKSRTGSLFRLALQVLQQEVSVHGDSSFVIEFCQLPFRVAILVHGCRSESNSQKSVSSTPLERNCSARTRMAAKMA